MLSFKQVTCKMGSVVDLSGLPVKCEPELRQGMHCFLDQSTLPILAVIAQN